MGTIINVIIIMFCMYAVIWGVVFVTVTGYAAYKGSWDHGLQLLDKMNKYLEQV